MFTIYSLKNNRGVASLEMVMIIVILLPLFVLVLHLQTATMQKFNQSVNTKNEAWKKRFDSETKEPQESSSLEMNQTAVEPFMWSNELQGTITANASETIQTGFMFDKWNSETVSKHTLIYGTWDYHDSKMDSLPNIKEIAPKIALDTITGFLKDLQDKMNDFLNEFMDQFNIFNQILSMLRDKAEEFERKVQAAGNNIFGSIKDAVKKTEEVKQAINKAVAKIQSLTNELSSLGFSESKIAQFREKYGIPERIPNEIDKFVAITNMAETFGTSVEQMFSEEDRIQTIIHAQKQLESSKEKIKNISQEDAQQLLKENPKLRVSLEFWKQKSAVENVMNTFAPNNPLNPIPDIASGQVAEAEAERRAVAQFLTDEIFPKVKEQGIQKDLKIRAEDYLEQERNAVAEPYTVPSIPKQELPSRR
ncbi:MAG: hypothetical protein LBG58_05560 [Planctomycetaceae bacterium]|jgi:predicted PurR-regulated permease PerM|nr:hypothetical protein [Planctomycetaceae bacterium]